MTAKHTLISIYWYSYIWKILGYQPVHFLHIRKTGGTVFKYAISQHKSLSKYLLLTYGHNVTLKTIPLGQKVIFFVRDPVKRYISGFNDRFRLGQPRLHIPWNSAENAAFSKFKSAEQLAESLSADHIDYQDALNAMQGIRHINTALTFWLHSSTYLMSRLKDVFFVGQTETLNEDFESLKQLLNMPSLMLPNDYVLAHRALKPSSVQMSENARYNIMKWYQSDYQILKNFQFGANNYQDERDEVYTL